MISIVSSSDLDVEKKLYKTFTTIIYTTGISENQELLWKDLVDECIQYDAETGGTIPAKAPQLIGNFTTNLAEGWMNVRCKFDGGKFVNRSQSGSWELRCMGAGLQHNMGNCWGPKTLSEMTTTCINSVYQNVMECSTKKKLK